MYQGHHSHTHHQSCVWVVVDYKWIHLFIFRRISAHLDPCNSNKSSFWWDGRSSDEILWHHLVTESAVYSVQCNCNPPLYSLTYRSRTCTEKAQQQIASEFSIKSMVPLFIHFFVVLPFYSNLPGIYCKVFSHVKIILLYYLPSYGFLAVNRSSISLILWWRSSHDNPTLVCESVYLPPLYSCILISPSI